MPVHIVGDDHPVVDRPEPAAHDDAHRADVEQAGNLLVQGAGDVQPLELGAEAGAPGVQGVAVEGARRGRLDRVHFGAHARHVAFQVNEAALDHGRLGLSVGLRVEGGPIVVVGVHRGDNGVVRRCLGPGLGIVDREGAAGGVHAPHLVRGELRRGGGEQQVADVRHGLTTADTEVHLAARVVDPHRVELLEKVRGKLLAADQVVHRVGDPGVGNHRARPDAPAADLHPADPAVLDEDALHPGTGADVYPLAEQFVRHQADQPIRAALEGVHAPVHEVGKDDAVGDGRFVQGGAVGIGDRLHEQPVDVGAAGEEAGEQLAGGQAAVVVEIHGADRGEELVDHGGGHTEPLLEDTDEILLAEGGGQGKLRVVEDDVRQFHDGITDGPAPVLAAGLDHAVGESVQADIEDVPAAPEPGRQSAQAGVVFEQQHRMARAGQPVGAGQAAQAGAHHHRVVSGKDHVRWRNLHAAVHWRR